MLAYTYIEQGKFEIARETDTGNKGFTGRYRTSDFG